MVRVLAMVSLSALALCMSPARVSGAPATAGIVRQAVSFTVSNPLEPGRTYTVRGELVRPVGCTASVVLAEHGLSYGYWAWDFPLQPATYSMAEALASRGHAVVAIDELGYGSSDHPDGYSLTVQSYAAMTEQMVQQLRSGAYTASGGAPAFAHVGLLGHSAGSEIVELAAGMFHDTDVMIATGYEHTPTGVSNAWLQREWIPGDNVRAARGDYEYFETDPATRAADMYNADDADPVVIARDNAMANLTPSGEIYSIGPQPSRFVIGSISTPVLVVLAERDVLFPPSGADAELSLFASAKDRSLHIVSGAGHALTLHRNAPVAASIVAAWLENHASAMPGC